jgi:hypothetical protein
MRFLCRQGRYPLANVTFASVSAHSPHNPGAAVRNALLAPSRLSRHATGSTKTRLLVAHGANATACRTRLSTEAFKRAERYFLLLTVVTAGAQDPFGTGTGATAACAGAATSTLLPQPLVLGGAAATAGPLRGSQ